MKVTIPGLLVIVALIASAFANPTPQVNADPNSVTSAGEWSKPVNGLSARLLLTLEELNHDGCHSSYRYKIIAEFKNAGGDVVAVSSQPSFTGIKISDADGKPVPESGYVIDGTVPLPQWAHLPGYSYAYLGVRVDMTTVCAAFPGSSRDYALLGIDDCVHSLPPGQYTLRGTFVAEKDKEAPDNQWLGEIDLAPVSFTFNGPQR